MTVAQNPTLVWPTARRREQSIRSLKPTMVFRAFETRVCRLQADLATREAWQHLSAQASHLPAEVRCDNHHRKESLKSVCPRGTCGRETLEEMRGVLRV
jgi:hypothetical protein